MIWGDCCLMELLFILSTKNNQVTANIPPPPKPLYNFLAVSQILGKSVLLFRKCFLPQSISNK